jgi:hypothetical protein
MAILIIEQQGASQAAALIGRVLIGRWPENNVVINDKAVSRIHAWIGIQDGQFYIADTGSRTGTIVNGEPLRERRVLCDGDEIRIGPALLHYQMRDLLPPDTGQIDLTPRSAEELSGAHGVFMDCVCGAPLWLPREFAGIGQCRYCGHTITRGPQPNAAVAPPPPTPATRNAEDDDFNAVVDEAFTRPTPKPMPPAMHKPITPQPARRTQKSGCGICHSPITDSDDVTTCPSCGLMFHAECWTENHGCSSYGCAQVGVLEKHG